MSKTQYSQGKEIKIMKNFKQNIINDILKENNLDAILLYSSENRFWFSNFASSEGYLLITKTKSFLFVDGRYISAALKNAQNISEIIRFGDVFKLINQKIKDLNINNLGFESEFIVYRQFLWFKQNLTTNLKAIDLSKIKTIKTQAEIEIMKKGCEITAKSFNDLLSLIKVGMSEKEVDWLIYKTLLKNGANSYSFFPVVVSGIRGALPHGDSSEKLIAENDFLTIDFGCTYKGYCTDMTRSIAFNNPDPKLIEIYEIVKQAQLKGIQAIKPGVTTKQIDSICRKYIEQKGYGKYFIHSTGHGLGIQIHEFPRLSQYCDVKLQENMIVTVEPGIYIPNLGGIRIEDDILVTKTGYQILTNATRDLIIIK